MKTYTHYDQVLDANTRHDTCMQAIVIEPMVPMALYPMDGEQWLCDLIDAVQDHPPAILLDEALARILNSLPAEEIEVLAVVIDSRRGHISARDVLKAFSRTQSAFKTAQAALARVIAEALLDGKLPYTVEMRDYAKKAWPRNWLATAYLCFDHDQAMQQLFCQFKEDYDDSLVSCMIGPLSHGELLSLKTELEQGSITLAASNLDNVLNQLERASNLPDFINRGDLVRWKTQTT